MSAACPFGLSVILGDDIDLSGSAVAPVLREGAPGRFADVLDWTALGELLRNQRFVPPRLTLTLGGSPIPAAAYTTEVRTPRGSYSQLDVAKLNAQLRAGATLIINMIDLASPPVRSLREAVERQAGVPVAVNLYASWGTTHGFDVHWDDHDVVVIQVAGQKQWLIYAPTKAWPTKEDRSPAPVPTEPPVDRLVLTDGDCLYLPRGWWHDVTATGGPSAHLTFALLRPRGDDFLQWAVREAAESEWVRRDVPLHEEDDCETYLAALRAAVGEVLSSDSLARFAEEQRATAALDPSPTLEALGNDDLLNWAQGRGIRLLQARASVELRGSDAVLLLAGREWQHPRAAEDVLRRLVAGEVVPLKTFADLSSTERLAEMVEMGHAAVV